MENLIKKLENAGFEVHQNKIKFGFLFDNQCVSVSKDLKVVRVIGLSHTSDVQVNENIDLSLFLAIVKQMCDMLAHQPGGEGYDY